MWLKSSVDRQDKIEFLNFRQTGKNRKSVRTKSNFFLVGQYRKLPSLSDGQTKYIIYNIFFDRLKDGGQNIISKYKPHPTRKE